VREELPPRSSDARGEYRGGYTAFLPAGAGGGSRDKSPDPTPRPDQTFQTPLDRSVRKTTSFYRPARRALGQLQSNRSVTTSQIHSQPVGRASNPNTHGPGSAVSFLHRHESASCLMTSTHDLLRRPR